MSGPGDRGRGGISARTVKLVAGKELLEALRDKRTLFVAMILPVLLYPLVMLGVAPLINLQKQKLQEERQQIAVTGAGAKYVIEEIIDQPQFDPSERDEKKDEENGESDEPEEPPKVSLEVVEAKDGTAARVMLVEGEIALWIHAEEDFGTNLFSERTGKLEVHRDSGDDGSNTAYGKWRVALARAEERLLDARMAAKDLDQGFRDPISAEAVDVASDERRGAYVLGKMLALILVVMTLSSSFYPAVDVVSGEKERGTMETLLVAPCGRAELVLGKFLAVLVVTLAAAVLNLVSMGLTMGPLVGGLGIDGLAGISFSWTAGLGILALLIPLSALFSALSLTLSTLARSVKEAQHYLTPLFLFVMPLAMVVIIPNIPLSPTLAAVPITNVVLFFRDLMLGKLEWLTASIVLVTTAAFAALSLWITVMLFLREETLFRGPEGTGSLISRPRPKPTPRAASAVFLFTACLAIIWYAQPLLPKDDLFLNAAVTQVGVVLLPCVLLAWWLRIDWKRTFQIGAPRWSVLALAVPIGLTAPVVNLWATRLFVDTSGEQGAQFRELAEKFERAITESHPLLLVAVLAVLPAVFEELVFRGFILSSFRASFRGKAAVARAVILTAVLFGLFHIMPEKWLSTGLTGLLLGYLAVTGRSIWPAVLAHGLNNASLVLATRTIDIWPGARPLYDPGSRGSPIVVQVAVLVFAGCLFAIVLRARARAASTDDSMSSGLPHDPPPTGA